MRANTNDDACDIGHIAQAAHALLIFDSNNRAPGPNGAMRMAFVHELHRLIDNKLQLRHDWGDTKQLAMLIVFLTEGYVPDLEKQHA